MTTPQTGPVQCCGLSRLMPQAALQMEGPVITYLGCLQLSGELLQLPLQGRCGLCSLCSSALLRRRQVSAFL